MWDESRLPTALPVVVTKDYKVDKRWKYQSLNRAPYNEIENLHRIDKLTVEMEFGLQSNIFHFHFISITKFRILPHYDI